MNNYHLAQINIARSRFELDTPQMAGFTSRLDEINAMADQSPGFVWRLQTQDGDATSLRVFDDPLLIINMSVWRDVKSLKHFVFETSHLQLLKGKKEWFERIDSVHHAMWWVPVGKRPSVEDGKEKIELLSEAGPGPDAFTFNSIYPAISAGTA